MYRGLRKCVEVCRNVQGYAEMQKCAKICRGGRVYKDSPHSTPTWVHPADKSLPFTQLHRHWAGLE